MIEYIFLTCFIVDSLIHLISVLKENKQLIFITKPLLMPILVLYFTFAALSLNIFNWLIVTALMGGFLGDTMLMFAENKKFFLLGMVSFLIGHIFYIISFLTSLSTSYIFNGLIIPFLTVPVLIILYLLLPKIKKNLGDMKIPVYVYMVVIVFMHFSTILRTTSFPIYCPCFILVYGGSLLFIISDGLIAYDKFNEPTISKMRFYIMLTYIMAQFLIIQGLLLVGILF